MNKVLAGTAAVGLAATMAACGSDSDSGDPKPQGQFKTLTGQTTTVVPAKSFTDALTQLKVTPGLVGNAKMTSEGFAFPITGGNATIYKKGDVKPYVQGTIEHQGSGLSLTAGGIKVELTNFTVDPGNNSKLTGDVSANGKSVVKDAKLFDLDGSTLQTPTISKSGVATLKGTTIYLSQAAADLLNQTFKINVLKGGSKTGTEIGTAIIRATGK
ncbi:ABC transporter substrate-binding protein [Jatrophihabitans endophyticus]|nr:hypothetical protein [Jatrophihabitans endophyticus]